MQFYTNYSLFTSLKLFYPKKEEVFKKIELNIRRLLGAAFYSTICLFVLQALVLQNFELQLIFLILSLIVHVLMILDSQLLKFLPKINNYIKVISWILIMAFTSTYLIWIFSTYFISFILTVIPIIIIILIVELAYLFRLLAFWPFVAANKLKIRFYLIVITYLNFITWPLYFININLFIDLNLVIASFLIILFITLIDSVLNEKFRKSLTTYSFIIFGGLVSVDIFFLLGFIPGFDLILNLSMSSLTSVIFLIIKIKPFKGHSYSAFSFGQ